MTEPLLQVESLSLCREGRDILRNVNLTVQTGQIHALLGLNGSGKSSLAYAIMGCEGYAPNAGCILFGGHNLAHLSITERARLGITLAWQEPARFEGLPVGKYIGVGVHDQEHNRDQVVAALEAVALPATIYGFRAADRTLSGGERKRVELAAVYAMRPRLAILDEPDSGIDVLSLGDIERLIRCLADEGSAVLLITHRDELVTMADVASLMCVGSILFTGDPSEARRYYASRCRPHLESLGAQPWDASTPEVQAALASNGRPVGSFSSGAMKESA
jgi:Fe-S cluster assembly ATP-binding protein